MQIITSTNISKSIHSLVKTPSDQITLNLKKLQLMMIAKRSHPISTNITIPPAMHGGGAE